ncbi:MAG: tyrosine-protein phosphatase [Mycobacterium sp.]|nr:tyrosine-protein phosphatase [Mycobacterium sp.]
MAKGIRGTRDLQGAWNFRDVADSTGVLRPGRLFRSADLSRLDDNGRDTLRQLAITDVADLRSPREVERRGPGQVPDNVDIHLLPIPDLAVDDTRSEGPDLSEAPHERAFRQLMANKPSNESVNDASTRYMIDEYRRFPTYNGAQRALHRIVTLLGKGRVVLAHCFAGKDRTGFVVALVLEAVGVDYDAIVADFLCSNEAAPQLRARILEMLQLRPEAELAPEAITFAEARLSDDVLGVREDYLDAARRTIDENFGSLDRYLRSADITAADVDRLRTALLG